MAYDDLTDSIHALAKDGGPALLPGNPKGSKVPVLINAFASMRQAGL
jgi:3-polyprenyl-4-hydroxybenzoate decarboxylase